MRIGPAALSLPPRPHWVTATVEDWCTGALLGVRTCGTSPTGVVKWYRTRTAHRVVVASASLDGNDLGPLPAHIFTVSRRLWGALGLAGSEPASGSRTDSRKLAESAHLRSFDSERPSPIQWPTKIDTT